MKNKIFSKRHSAKKFLAVILSMLTGVICFFSAPVSAEASIINPDSNGRAYVTNGCSRTITVIDLATNITIATIPIGAYPESLSVSPNGKRVYTVNPFANTVTVIDTNINAVIATIPVGIYPTDVTFSPDSTRAYVTDYNTFSVYVINTSTNAVIATIAGGSQFLSIAVTPDGTRGYATNYFAGLVTVLDLTTNSVITTIPGFGVPTTIQVTPDGSRVYVVNQGPDTVSVINTATNTITTTIPVGLEPVGIKLTPDGTRAYVTNYSGNTVSVIDTSTNTVIQTITGFFHAHRLNITPDGLRVYVANFHGDTISVINTATNSIINTLTGFSCPFGIAFGSLPPVDSTPPVITPMLFGVPELVNTPQSIGGEIYRFKVPQTGNPVLDTTITDSSFYNPFGLAFSPTGELFVINRGPNAGQGGSLSRFLNPTGTPTSNGAINSANFYVPHGAAFRGNELFVAEGFSNTALRFVIDSNGNASPNGALTDGLYYGKPRGVVVSPWGEIFVSQCCGINYIQRYLIDGGGNAVPNGVISGGGLDNPHDMEFSPQGELFVANFNGNSVSRFTFDAQRNASSAGQISSPTFNIPIGLAFSPSGELFVCNYGNPTISRFIFNGSNAVLNGTFSAPRPLTDIEFAPQDSTAPTTIAAPNPNANATGWNNSNMNVSLDASDNAGGAGISNITYSADGAQTVPSTTVNGSNASLSITAEGETTITYFARDNAGNIEAAKTLVVKIDKTAPVITSQATASGNPYTLGNWTNQDVIVSFDCTDSLSGVGEVTPPVTLSTEGANQSANGTCHDLAGNSADTSFTGIEIDKTAPTISVTAPTSGNYLLNQAVTVSFNCTDSLSGVSDCTGTTANGGGLDTSSTGAKTFTVNASDNAGNIASPTVVNYSVVFGIEVLFDQTKAHKAGSNVPVKIRLVDAGGANVSTVGIVIHAISVIQLSSQASTSLDDAGNSNADLDFRYDESLMGYIFNLKTTGYETGTYQLNFTAGNSPTNYSVQFQVRQ